MAAPISRFTGLRRRLLALPGFSRSPCCPTCTRQVFPQAFAAHVAACERYTAELAIEVLDRKLAEFHATEPRVTGQVNPAEESLRRERLDWCYLLHPEHFCECGRVLVGQPDSTLCRRCDVAF